ncbi:MAG: methylenetetrahydrofolate reductase, partial [Nocardioidaceae bacterium]|nr:methylenetetrahydrofolate reductase [Nocardioidaceae bacterium]
MTDRPSADSPEAKRRRALAALLDRPRYEVLPVPGTAEQVGAHVPTTVPVTVTVSPRRGLEPTLELTEELVRGGYSAVPHLAARLVYDETHLAEILVRLETTGVREAFVVAGDGKRPVGGFSDSFQLLTAVARLQRSGLGRKLRSMGVSGYPEGHPLVTADELDRALGAKQHLSSYVVTQMCFDPGAVLGWIGHARELGVRLPVHVG